MLAIICLCIQGPGWPGLHIWVCPRPANLLGHVLIVCAMTQGAASSRWAQPLPPCRLLLRQSHEDKPACRLRSQPRRARLPPRSPLRRRLTRKVTTKLLRSPPSRPRAAAGRAAPPRQQQLRRSRQRRQKPRSQPARRPRGEAGARRLPPARRRLQA